MTSLAHLLEALAMQKMATPKPMGVLSYACTASQLGHLQRPQVKNALHDSGSLGQALYQRYLTHVR